MATRRVKVHESVTIERIVALVEGQSLDDPGICVACGADADGVEPDARKYTCAVCGEPAVYGAEELMVRLVP